MIFTQSVSAWANVGADGDFRLKSAEVQRQIGRSIGTATIKGFIDDADKLYLGAPVRVHAGAISSSDPWNSDLSGDGQIFGGIAHSAKQNEEGVITIEAFEVSEKMNEQTVQYGAEQEQSAHSVLVDLIREVYGNITHERQQATTSTPFIEEQEEFTGSGTQAEWRFGSANRGDPLIDVLESLSNALGANIWVDREGVVNVTPYPTHREWEVPFITELNAGEETRNAEQIIFEGTGATSELGAGAASIYNQTRLGSSTDIARSDDEEPPAPEKVLTDENVNSQEDADRRSFNEAVRQDQNRDMGDITIIGTPEMELYDHVVVPDLEYRVDGGFTNPAIPNDVQAGKYKVDGLTHKINPSDGFLTTLQLSPPIEQTFNRCVSASNRAIQQEHLDQYSNSVVESNLASPGGPVTIEPSDN